MKKATPVEMRKALETVEALKKSGINFVAIPVVDDSDYNYLVGLLMSQLEKMEGMTDEQRD